MVRLRVYLVFLVGDSLLLFQFLHGAIKGALKKIVQICFDDISIPTWCD